MKKRDQKEYRRRQRAERKAQGLCVHCTTPAEAGKTRCERHANNGRPRKRICKPRQVKTEVAA